MISLNNTLLGRHLGDFLTSEKLLADFSKNFRCHNMFSDGDSFDVLMDI